MRLQGKAAIVTGAGSGIGEASAKRFAAEGAKVAVADIDGARAKATAEAIAGAGGAATAITADVSRSADVQALVDQATKAYGRIDILLSNAGTFTGTPFLDVTEAEWDQVIDTNLKGMFLVGQAVARRMAQDGKGGSIINMSSINAVLAIPTAAAYCASKGGVKQLTGAMAVALAPYKIRVNAIGPGTVATGMTREMVANPEVLRGILSRTPIGRVARPEEIANIAVFLASDEASYMTGATIYADGGRMPLNGVVPVPADAVR
jgi:NAD(P)-dependent dehydrogenase (short-subunit alcohol dehydrogenase family)